MRLDAADSLIRQSLSTKYLILDESEAFRLDEKIQKLFGIARTLDKQLERDYVAILNRKGIFNEDRDTKVRILSRELSPFCDRIAECFPGVGLGYYSKDLDSILVYSPTSTLGHMVGMSLPENHIGNTVMSSRRERMYIGSMVRGDVLSCFQPIIRKRRSIGYCWANETVESIYRNSISRDRPMMLSAGMEPLLGLMGLLLIETRSLAFLGSLNKYSSNIIQYIEYFLNNISIGIIILNQQREALYISTGAEKLLKIDVQRWMGRDFSRYFQATFSHDLATLIAENDQHFVFISGAPRIRHDGTDLTFFISTMNIDGSLFHFLFFEDRSQQNRAKAKELKHQELSVLGSLSASIAHEIRNPLTIIHGLAKLMPEKIQANDTAFLSRFSQIIDSEIRKVDSLVESLLDIGRSSKLDHLPLSVNRVLRASVDLLGHMLTEKGIELVEKYQEPLPTIFGCTEDLHKAFTNLILNSIEAMPTGGQLRVATEYRAPSNFLCVIIADTGQPIPPQFRDRVFTPFFTTKERGTGLGLFLVHKVVQEHKGYIEWTSEKHRGTCFRISLPTCEFMETIERTDEIKKTRTGD